MMDNEYIHTIRCFLADLFCYYLSKENCPDTKIVQIQQESVFRALEAFSKGYECNGFSFSLNLRIENELRYISFYLEDNFFIQVSEGGSVYDPYVGSDSYTSWNFTLMNNGETEGNLLLNISDAVEMIKLGAQITFEYPEELIEDTIRQELERERETEFLNALAYSYECLMSRLAEPIVKRIVRKVKRQLQSYTRNSGMMQSEEDSGLLNVWDEFCVQLQSQESIFFDAYLYTVESLVMDVLQKCTEDELIILWTQTEAYEYWKEEIEDVDCNDYLKRNFELTSICDFLVHELEYEAANYSSKRIENYLY